MYRVNVNYNMSLVIKTKMTVNRRLKVMGLLKKKNNFVLKAPKKIIRAVQRFVFCYDPERDLEKSKF